MYKNLSKTIIVTFTVFAVIFQSNAAIVSDNDGAAFVTKAEFDSLKADFQKEIDSYNMNIDNKIETAISQYLNGIKNDSESTVNLLFPVNDETTNKPISVKDKYNSIKEQTFQGGTYLHNLWATYGTGPSTLEAFNPFKTSNMTQIAFVGNGYYDQMKGFVFSKDNPYVLTNKYDYDNCGLILSQTSTQNQNYGEGGIGERFFMGIQPGTLTNKRINTTYTSSSGIGNGSNNWGCGTSMAQGYFVNSDSVPASTVKNYWLDVLPMDSTFASRFARRDSSSQYNETLWGCEYMISHSTKDEDYNIYVYPKCSDVIYVHADDEEVIEEYSDYMTDVETANVLGGKNTNLYLTNRTSRWMWWYQFKNDERFVIGPRRNWRFTPKFKLKNTTSINELKPNTASVTGGTKFWNTLNQFRNGHIKYIDHLGATMYPHFYGGLPLLAVSTKYTKFKFDINISPTISSTVNNLCVRVMSEEFPNGNDITAWTANQRNALKEINGTSKSGTTTTSYTYDSTNKYLIIPKDTDVTITLDNPNLNSTYFLRWWEQGNTDNAGGQIEFLGNGKVTKAVE